MSNYYSDELGKLLRYATELRYDAQSHQESEAATIAYSLIQSYRAEGSNLTVLLNTFKDKIQTLQEYADRLSYPKDKEVAQRTADVYHKLHSRVASILVDEPSL